MAEDERHGGEAHPEVAFADMAKRAWGRMPEANEPARTPLTPPETITHEQLRHAGFSGMESMRDEVALRLLCAFVGVDPVLAPPGWWAHPNKGSADAWKRVGDEAKRIFGRNGEEA